MATGFASKGDTADEKVSFMAVGDGLCTVTAGGDLDAGGMIAEAQAARFAQTLTDCMREVPDQPVSQVALTRCQALRVPCVSAFGAGRIIMSGTAARAHDEARGIHAPRVCTAKRGLDMWAALQG